MGISDAIFIIEIRAANEYSSLGVRGDLGLYTSPSYVRGYSRCIVLSPT